MAASDCDSRTVPGCSLVHMKRKLWQHYVAALVSNALHTGKSTVLIDAFAGKGMPDGSDMPNTFEEFGTSPITLRVVVEELIQKKNLKYRFNPSKSCNYVTKPIEPITKSGSIDLSILVQRANTIYLLNSKPDNCLALCQDVCRVLSCYDISSNVHNIQGKILSISCYDKNFPVVVHIVCCDFYQFPVPEIDNRTCAVTLIDPPTPCRLPMAKVSSLIQRGSEIFLNFPKWFNELFITKFPTTVFEIYGITLPKEIAKKDKNSIAKYVYDTVTYNCYSSRMEKQDILLRNYERSLKAKHPDTYAVSYDVVDSTNNTKINLYHVMRDLSNFRQMKEEAMKSKPEPEMSKYAALKFERHGKIQNASKAIDIKNLAAEIFEKFQGGSAVVRDIEEYVWLQTPFVFRKSALALMETEVNPRCVSVLDQFGRDPRGRKGIFPDGELIITFRSFSMDEEFEQLGV